MSLWSGLVTGLVTGAASGSTSAGSLAAGAGVTAGIVTGLVSAGTVSPSVAHVRLLDVGGIGGMLIGGGLYLAAANDNVNGQALAGTAALGTVAGLTTAWFATRGMGRDDGPAPTEPSASAILWTPTIMPARGGATFGVVGSL